MSVYTWGWGKEGQLGLGDTNGRHVPVLIEPWQETRIVQVSCGGYHTAALTDDGDVYTWGGGNDGKLGHGDQTDQCVPRLVKALHGKNIREVSCGNNHMAAVTVAGSLYAWGSNFYGQLGHGNTTELWAPSLVNALKESRVRNVACGWNYTLALLESKDVYAWGASDDGKTGLDKRRGYQLAPCLVEKLRGKNIVQISSYFKHSAALSEFGEVFTFGWGWDGRLGHGSKSSELVPRSVEALADKRVKQVECGGFHTAAMTESGEVYAWGSGSYGQLGYNYFANTFIPTRIEALVGKVVKQITCGRYHTIALTDTGEAYTWGSDLFGQLGNNDPTYVALPKLVMALKGKRVIDVASYGHHSAALVESMPTFHLSKPASPCSGSVREIIDKIELSEMTFVSALLGAAWMGDVEAVRNALQAGEHVDTRDIANKEETPLIWAASRGHVEVLKLLLEKSADMNAQTKFGSTALKLAAGYGHLDAVRLLLDRGANIELSDQNGLTPLHDAVLSGHIQVVGLLLDRHASVDAESSELCTPLGRAVRRGRLEIVRMLLYHGASVDSVDSDGSTPLIHAAMQGDLEIARFLLDCGSSVNAADIAGYTPLMHAASNGHVEIVELLMSRDASIGSKLFSWFRTTPLKLAKANGHADVVAVIEKFRASPR